MLRRCARDLSRVKQRNQIPNMFPLSSIDRNLSPEVRNYCRFSREVTNRNESDRCKSKLELTPDLVNSTLRGCPSDLIALKFFFWCAKQNNYFHDALAFDYMVSVTEKLTVRYDTIRGLLRELENGGCAVKPHIFVLLLRIYWRGGMHKMVIEVYEEMMNRGFEPNTLCRNIIMDVFFKIELVDLALKVLQETKVPNFLSFNIALCNLCKINDLNNLKDVMRVMLKKGFYPNSKTLEMIFNGFCKTGRLLEANQILGLMICMGIPVSVSIWSMLINGYFGLRQPEKTVDLLHKMLETGCSPNVVTYTTLIKGYVDSGMIENAFIILNIMKSERICPDLVLSNALIHIFTKMGRFDDALSVFCSFSKRKLVPNKYTFSSLVSNICASRRFSLLPNIGNGIAVEADIVVCNSLMNYFCKAGYPSFAVKLYNDMVDRGFIADNYSFACLLSALCREGKVSEAVEVYTEMVLNHKNLDAYIHTAIISGLVRSGKHQTAIHLFRRGLLEKYPLDVVSYLAATRGLVRAGRTGEACTLSSEMKEAGISPNSQIYMVIIFGLCREKNVERIKELLEEIRNEKIELDSKSVIRLQVVLSRLSLDLSEFKDIFGLETPDLAPDDGTSAPLFDASYFGAKAGKNGLFTNDDMSESDCCSSDDLPDVVASVS